ncbi:MAG: hypothetical protein PHV55_06940 [Candidatus Omnitrophica bacterium]|nr:hypothetical protein [Candidatus Omnitrophota bacterium]
MLNQVEKRRFLLRSLVFLCLFSAMVTIITPFIYAEISTTQEQQVVGDFATFIINILTGPISKILGAALLIAGVIALLNGKQGLAIACGFGFMILMFIPKILEGLFNQ